MSLLGFDPSFKNLACLATLKSCDTTKLSMDDYIHTYTGWNDKIVVLKKTTRQLYLKTFIEKINSGNLIM